MSEIPTIAEAGRRFAARTLSPVELVQDCFERIHRLDGELHAFLLPTEERALSEARAAEARFMKGAAKGPLDGIPFGHKDIYNTAGLRTTAHSRLLEHNVPDTDARTVTLLAEAGTVMMGKLSTHEFALGGPSFDLPWPPARNPWNPAHFPAGSSSGTGAAVAAGMVLGGTGSDTGGSIRGPATLCGITGIKPTYGLVSRTGILPLSFTLDHSGPMAWTVEDCALLLQAMAGHDPADPASADRPVPDFTAGIGAGVKGLRFGVIRHFHETDFPASPATCAGIDAAADTLRRLGADVRDVTLSPLPEYHACGYVILITEAFAVHEPWLKTRFAEYGQLFRDRVSMAALIRGSDYVQALRRRRELCLEMLAAMEDVDVLIAASQPGEAPPIDAVPKWASLEKGFMTFPFNVTGFPAIAVSTGFGVGDLPVGLQMAAHPFAEPLLFRAAHAFEQTTPWRSRRPPMVG